MFTFFKNARTNRIEFKGFKIVSDSFCEWNKEAFYLGEIKRKNGIYYLYNINENNVAILGGAR